MRPEFKSAVHLLLMRAGHILLLWRFNTGYQDGKYSVVAGHLEGGEQVRAAAVREAKEEAGIDIREADVDVVQVMHRFDGDERIDFFVTARQWQGEARNMEPERCDHLSWFAFDDLPENIIPYVRRAIQNYHSGQWFDSFGWENSDKE